ncbi:MAG: dihydrodipicolinate synthase family protein [Bryobacteraceae bacterium]|nr:dihydrodipicolinate synthase family protein [Bryobacteraceae bacterium]
MTKLAGLYPAVVTPFRDARSIDLDALAENIQRLLAAGMDGVYVGGNTGEWYLQTLEERKAAARTAIEAARGRGRVLVHVGCNTTEDAVELARYAESAGADGVSSLPPYVARCTGREVVNYYRRLASATSLPCFIYHFPAITGPLPLDTLAALPGIRGVKFTDMNLYEMGLLAGRTPEPFLVFNGHDQVLLPGLLMGARGGVGSFYNVYPELFVSLYRSWIAGDIPAAGHYQRQINERIAAVKKYRLIPALRFLMEAHGLEPGVCREPVLPLSREEQHQLASDLEALGGSPAGETADATRAIRS